jgi:hypothetical protein
MRDRKTKVSKGRREMTDRAAAERDAARLNLRPAADPESSVRLGALPPPVLTPKRERMLEATRYDQRREMVAGPFQANEKTGRPNLRRLAQEARNAEANAEMDRRTGGRVAIVTPKTA